MKPTKRRNGQVTEIFWGEIAPCEHIVQFYKSDNMFLDMLEDFVAGGLRAGEGVIVIATAGHVGVLEERLRKHGLDPEHARQVDQYITVDVDEMLSKFMVNGWPDRDLFHAAVTEVLVRARKGRRNVRSFGEMVAVLWARGHKGATVQLETLWQALCQSEAFSLFCAYPSTGFGKDLSEAIEEICSLHTSVLHGEAAA